LFNFVVGRLYSQAKAAKHLHASGPSNALIPIHKTIIFGKVEEKATGKT